VEYLQFIILHVLGIDLIDKNRYNLDSIKGSWVYALDTRKVQTLVFIYD